MHVLGCSKCFFRACGCYGFLGGCQDIAMLLLRCSKWYLEHFYVVARGLWSVTYCQVKKALCQFSDILVSRHDEATMRKLQKLFNIRAHKPHDLRNYFKPKS